MVPYKVAPNKTVYNIFPINFKFPSDFTKLGANFVSIFIKLLLKYGK